MMINVARSVFRQHFAWLRRWCRHYLNAGEEATNSSSLAGATCEDGSIKESDTLKVERLADKIEKAGRATSAELARILKSGYHTGYVMPDANIIIGHCPKGWYAMDGNDPDFAFFETVEECLAHPIHGKSVAERLDAGGRVVYPTVR